MKNKIGYITFEALVAGIVVVGLLSTPSASYAATKAQKVSAVKSKVATQSKNTFNASKTDSDAVEAALAAFTASADSLVTTIDQINNPVVADSVDPYNE